MQMAVRPFFSVIIPALNEEKYIGGILEDLARQTFKDFEVIVVDGKSSDRTLEVARSFSNRIDIKVVELDRKGVAYQRNFGVGKAVAEQLVFLDADTRIEKGFFEKLKTQLAIKKYDTVTAYQEQKGAKWFDAIVFGGYNLWMSLMQGVSPTGAGAFIWSRRKAFETVGGFDEKAVSLEDCDFLKRVVRAGFKFGVLKEPRYFFSVRRLDKEGRGRYNAKIIWNSIKYYATGRDPQMEYEWGRF